MTEEDLIKQIEDISEECKESNWNGENADPVTIEAKDRAIAFVKTLYPLLTEKEVEDVEVVLSFIYVGHYGSLTPPSQATRDKFEEILKRKKEGKLER